MDNELPAGRNAVTALEKVRLVSEALSEAARRTRISKRTRHGHAIASLRAQRAAVAMRWAARISFAVMVALPSLASIVYYGFVASDQYVATADFMVSGGEPMQIDGLTSFTGMPAMATVQDTQIIVNYVQSRAALEKLQTLIDVRSLYSIPSVDRLSRLNPNKPIESVVGYWKKMVSASIKMPSGAVELRVRAFTPQDASRIAQAVLTLCDDLVNSINDRMINDAVSNAQQELDQTTARLTQARVALEQARDDRGVLDASKAGDALNKLIGETRAGLLTLQQQYDAELKFVAATAPQMIALKARIDAAQAQIGELELKVTTTRLSSADQPTLAGSMTKFAELNVENDIAEKLYGVATASLEVTRIISESKLMYLNDFVRPVPPEQPEYPRRGFQIFLTIAGSLALWGLCCGIAQTVRKRMS